MEGVWVVGGVERTAERNMFAVTTRSRNARTLKGIIENHIQPGSIIYTDCWRGYRDEDLADIKKAHDTVNHSINFVDPVTGVHTALPFLHPVYHRSPDLLNESHRLQRSLEKSHSEMLPIDQLHDAFSK